MQRHFVFAVLHLVHAQQTHQALLYPLMRVKGMDGEVMDIH